jgi:hypothetical protein
MSFTEKLYTRIFEHKGIVRVRSTMLLERPLTLHKIQQQMLIVSIERDVRTDEIIYTGYSFLFDKGAAEYRVIYGKYGAFRGFEKGE